jgi:hypothetical protein
MKGTTSQSATYKLNLRRHELMDSMMQASGADALEAIAAERGQAFVSARATCRWCPHESECRQWLLSGRETQGPASFCPNACFFRSLQAAQS